MEVTWVVQSRPRQFTWHRVMPSPSDSASRVDDLGMFLRDLIPLLCRLKGAAFGTPIALETRHLAWADPNKTNSRAFCDAKPDFFWFDAVYFKDNFDLVFIPEAWAPEDLESWIEKCVLQFSGIRERRAERNTRTTDTGITLNGVTTYRTLP